MRQVGGVIVARFKGGAEISAQKRGFQLGYQFLGRVGIVAKTFAQDAREAGRAGRPVVSSCAFVDNSIFQS